MRWKGSSGIEEQESDLRSLNPIQARNHLMAEGTKVHCLSGPSVQAGHRRAGSAYFRDTLNSSVGKVQNFSSQLGTAIVPQPYETNVLKGIQQPVHAGTGHRKFLGDVHHGQRTAVRQRIEQIGAICHDTDRFRGH